MKAIVDAGWLFGRLNDPDVVILDASIRKISGRLEATAKTIPGAVFFDLENSFSDTASNLPHTMVTAEKFEPEAQKLGIGNESILVVYDADGIYSSARAWWMFRAMGHENVFVLDGGLPEWLNSGFRVSEKHRVVRDHGNFNAVYDAKCFCGAASVLEAIKSDRVIVDARNAERFAGLAAEPRPGLRLGHIPGSVNIPFADCLDGNRLKSVATLKQLFGRLGTQDTSLIFSCGSGVTACIVALAAYVAGFDRLCVYDGSWGEWGKGGFPIA